MRFKNFVQLRFEVNGDCSLSRSFTKIRIFPLKSKKSEICRKTQKETIWFRKTFSRMETYEVLFDQLDFFRKSFTVPKNRKGGRFGLIHFSHPGIWTHVSMVSVAALTYLSGKWRVKVIENNL